ncbi:DUF4825 domain-containing protein [Falsibacillus albus]|uniref:DUF4825 domain-containing protein n=1 Tax=Falsibacillus albus TaxID=2478915 RepID=A0A3L7K1N4_9BACI|nr:DUF4825 domain-containing protein [Falsibacillus albus]RLQ96264.1 DUF4825 domain-containing protein [Falsibacillus albus]
MGRERIDIDQEIKNMPKPALEPEKKKKMLKAVLSSEENSIMDRKKRRWILPSWQLIAGTAAFLLVCFFAITGLNGNHYNGSSKSIEIAGEHINLVELSKERTPYVGENSKVGQIVYSLPGADFVSEISLQTKKHPFGLTVNYGSKQNSTKKKEEFETYWKNGLEEKALMNATSFFILIDNVEEININISTEVPQHFTFNRKQLDDFYGRDLRQYGKDPELWKSEVFDHKLNHPEKIEKLFQNMQ